jgi:hypothetical protein
MDYCRIVQDEETYDELMATIGHRRSLVNQSRMIRHLWLTSRILLQEADRQQTEANRIFERMERMGLQQELYGSRWTRSPRRERSVTPQSSSFYSCNERLSDGEADDEPTFLSSGSPFPPGSIHNPLVISDDKDDIESLISRPSYREARSFSTPIRILLHCQDCVDQQHLDYQCPQYICDHCLQYAPMHQMTDCPNR